MYFVDSLVALSEKLGVNPDDIFFLSIFAAILCWEVMGWTFFLLGLCVGAFVSSAPGGTILLTMTFFETFPFFADPVFILFLIGCGCFVRIGSLLADWFIESLKLFCQCWRKPR